MACEAPVETEGEGRDPTTMLPVGGVADAGDKGAKTAESGVVGPPAAPGLK